MAKEWTLEMRKVLQAYLRQGYQMKDILEEFHEMDGEYAEMTQARLSREIKQGLTEEQGAARRWIKYDIVRSYEKVIGKDAVDFLRTHPGCIRQRRSLYGINRM